MSGVRFAGLWWDRGAGFGGSTGGGSTAIGSGAGTTTGAAIGTGTGTGARAGTISGRVIHHASDAIAPTRTSAAIATLHDRRCAGSAVAPWVAVTRPASCGSATGAAVTGRAR